METKTMTILRERTTNYRFPHVECVFQLIVKKDLKKTIPRFLSVFRIRDILRQIRILGPVPTLFVSGFQDANKVFIQSFFAYDFL
jgi:hypothetical protein